MRLLPGTHHWVVPLAHLAVGVVAMAIGGGLAAWSQQLFAPRAVGFGAAVRRGA